MKTFKQFLLEIEFWGDAGAGVLPIAEDTGRILLGLRSRDVNEPGQWGTIGGAIDKNEDPKNAALRELKEETKYKGQIRLEKAYIFKKDGFQFHNFIGLVSTEFIAITNWETDRFEWFDINNLPSKLHFGIKALLKNSALLIKKYTNENF